MKREEYNQCMKGYMTGSKTREQRQRDMCIGAKLCTKKASSPEEAAQLCATAAAEPKPPKMKKGRKVCTLQDLDAIGVCMAENINLSALTGENMQEVFAAALSKCSGAKSAKGKRITSASQVLSTMDPQHIKALETIAKLSKQAEGRPWGRV